MKTFLNPELENEVRKEIAREKVELINFIKNNLCQKELNRDGREFLDKLKVKFTNIYKDDT